MPRLTVDCRKQAASCSDGSDLFVVQALPAKTQGSACASDFVRQPPDYVATGFTLV